ncbi:hypothetical protein BKM31_33410 [[Actinomadura] parvosata subsp. kistnae]|uniref:Uncharacterized protein n=1 Tax=[Actinomadura] parvosata subsp. kistnae TaxID=1909395 RepID=A0A1V0A671_9ACTN|nr:hypothetical protein BKM31_33410 [Nonomuraea sp. ATCC 55076]
MPAVAVTERAKPYERARSGANRTRKRTVADRAARPSFERPVPMATAAARPMRRARSTLGDGRATTVNASIATAAKIARRGRGRPIRRESARAAPATIARLAPETAFRWLRPASLRSAVTCGSMRETSPTTRPGRRPRWSGGSTSAADRRPALRLPAAVWRVEGGVRTRGGVRASMVAASRVPGVGVARRPVTSTSWVGRSEAQARPVAKTVMGTLTACLVVGVWMSLRSAETT